MIYLKFWISFILFCLSYQYLNHLHVNYCFHLHSYHPTSNKNEKNSLNVNTFIIFPTDHIDIVGPLPSIYNYPHLYLIKFNDILTCIESLDWHSNINCNYAQLITQVFINTWITRGAVTLHVVIREFNLKLSYHKLRPTTYHPECNCVTESMQNN